MKLKALVAGAAIAALALSACGGGTPAPTQTTGANTPAPSASSCVPAPGKASC